MEDESDCVVGAGVVVAAVVVCSAVEVVGSAEEDVGESEEVAVAVGESDVGSVEDDI